MTRAVPRDETFSFADKKWKYQPLCVELTDMYKLQGVEIVPAVVSANESAAKIAKKFGKKLQLQENHIRKVQKSALMATYDYYSEAFNFRLNNIHCMTLSRLLISLSRILIFLLGKIVKEVSHVCKYK